MVEQTRYESKPSGKVVITWVFTRLLLTILIYGLILSYVFLRASFSLGKWGTYLLAGTIALVVLVLIYLIFLWKTYNYKITNKGVYFKGGIIVRKQKFVPFFKITNIETTQNIIEQILGINRLGFQTAGTGAQQKPEIVFEGLEEIEKPRKLAYQLIEKTKRSSRNHE